MSIRGIAGIGVSQGENCVIQFAVHPINKQNPALPSTSVGDGGGHTVSIIIVKMAWLRSTYLEAAKIDANVPMVTRPYQ